jgi:methanogenic corrinoid protein MtbC1
MKNTQNFERVTEQLFSHLVSGDRRAARQLVETVYEAGISPETLAKDVFWPILEMTSSLFRKDQITNLSNQYATRILRMLVDQGQARYTQRNDRNQRICMFCGPNEAEELAGQLVADLLEADGYDVTFAGGGVANDEIREELTQREPDILLLFASSANSSTVSARTAATPTCRSWLAAASSIVHRVFPRRSALMSARQARAICLRSS